MNLYEKKTEIQAKNSEKKIQLKIVIQRVLEKLKQLAIAEIKIQFCNLGRISKKYYDGSMH